jgi:hypothetical protein
MLHFDPKFVLKIRRFQISDAPEALNFGVMEAPPCILAMFVRLGTNVNTEQVYLWKQSQIAFVWLEGLVSKVGSIVWHSSFRNLRILRTQFIMLETTSAGVWRDILLPPSKLFEKHFGR